MSNPNISRAEDRIDQSIGAAVEAIMAVYRFNCENGTEENFVAGLSAELAMYRRQHHQQMLRRLETGTRPSKARLRPVGGAGSGAAEGEAFGDAEAAAA